MQVVIYTIEDLIDLSIGNNRGTAEEPLEVELANDVDFESIEPGSEYYQYRYSWPGFYGAGATAWYMNFDGKGHAIKNISYQGANPWGFIYQKGSGTGYIRNVDLKDLNVATSGNFYGMTATNNTTIDSCNVTGFIACNICYGVFGGNGTTYGLVRNCSFVGSISARGSITVLSTGRVINCWARADLKSESNTASIRLIAPDALNSHFVGTYLPISTTPTTGLTASGTANFCYAVLKNISELFSLGFESTSPIFGTNSHSCCYESIAISGGEYDGEARPWSSSSSEWRRFQVGEDEEGSPIYKEVPRYAELNLKIPGPFISRGYPIRSQAG